MSSEIPDWIPSPYYTLINSSRGSDPAVLVVNSALRLFARREYFAWQANIQLTCKDLGANGMPTSEEGAILNTLEDSISGGVLNASNGVFLAKVTCRGQRELKYRVHDPEITNTFLKDMTSLPNPIREWEYRIEHDPEWSLAHPELSLLERDPRFN